MVARLILGGGYGFLSGEHGLVVDNLVEVNNLVLVCIQDLYVEFWIIIDNRCPCRWSYSHCE